MHVRHMCTAHAMAVYVIGGIGFVSMKMQPKLTCMCGTDVGTCGLKIAFPLDAALVLPTLNLM